MRVLGVGVAMVFLLLRADCDNRESCAKLSRVDATVELGTGSAFFRPLAAGADLEITQGPQGGMHVWVSARFSGVMAGDPSKPFDAINPLLEIELVDADGALIANSASFRALKIREDGTIEAIGEIVQFDATRIDDVAWKEVDVELYFLDSCGTELTATRGVRLTNGCSEEATD